MSNRVGRAIAAARKRRKWSQADLAREADVSRAAVSLWEMGKRAPWPSSRDRVATVLGLAVEDLVP